MAQSATTVTAENPTPPTNLSYVGATPPTDPAQPYADDGWPASPGALNLFAAKTAASNTAGAPGAGVSYDHEGRGNETSVTISYPGTAFAPWVPVTMVGCGPAYSPFPNANHASSLTPLTVPTLTSLGTTSSASGTGTVSQTVTGTNFTRQSQIVVDGVKQTTTYTSATSLTAPNVPKRATPGTSSVVVRTGGVIETAPQTWTFT